MEWDLTVVKAPSRAVKMIKVSMDKVAGFTLSFDGLVFKHQEQLEKANRNCRRLVANKQAPREQRRESRIRQVTKLSELPCYYNKK